MVWACLSLVAVGFAVSMPLTWMLVRLGHRLGTFDSAGVPGQIKAQPRKVPNTGGIAVFLGIAAPMALGLAILGLNTGWTTYTPSSSTPHSLGGRIAQWVPGLSEHLAGLQERTFDGIILLIGLLVIHIMGLIDDRRPMRAIPKLIIMLAVAAGVSILTGSRLLTLLDFYAGGPWLSYVVTVAWLVVVMNAMNFLDNMDGLSAGIGLIASAFFLAAALVGRSPQWFIAACLALLIGSLAGFLVFNAPRPWSDRKASIFLGDGGSLVVGLLLGLLTVRTTFIDHGPPPGFVQEPGVTCTLWSGSSWYGIFMPLVVLAIPLYDFCTVVTLRLSQRRNPLVGDLQHLSHRLVQRGLSRRGAVYVLWGLTAATGCGAIALRSMIEGWQAVLIGVQTLMILAVLFALEHASRRLASNPGSAPDRPSNQSPS